MTLRHPGRRRNAYTAGAALAKRGTPRLDWRDPYYLAIGMPTRWFGLITLTLYLAINTLFAGIYFLSPGCIANARPGSFGDLSSALLN